jgi:hypothetical protein
MALSIIMTEMEVWALQRIMKNVLGILQYRDSYFV